MINHSFQKFLFILTALTLLLLVALAIYCRRKSHSFIGTGRMAEIEAWSFKASLSWAATGAISLMMILEFI